MKVLLSWLKEYVNIDISPEMLRNKLFSTGFEVEGIEYLGDGIEKVYVGEVTSIEKYEGTHLYLCHVDCGKHGNDHVILTGAKNVYMGAKVPTCIVGAKLPSGIEITPRRMKDIMSYGMLCSGEELGLNSGWYPGADIEGIMILDNDAPVGTDIVEYLELDDYVFDISITANRPDCQSVLGIAREVAAFLGKSVKEPDMSFVCTDVKRNDVAISVEDKDLCPRYVSHYVYDVKYMESPIWMRRRLIASGHNSINAMVDITNYVLTEIGQPMHAFDLSTLYDSSIVVRRAKEGEELITLDEKNRVLNNSNLLICDGEKPIGLAGVMGGLNSEITEKTKEVLFESAKFRRDSVRKTARGLGIQSDAASRYEKGVDEYSVECGMARALNLVQTIGVGKVSSTMFDISAGAPTEKRMITVPIEKIEFVLGIIIPESEIIKILNNLAFEVEIHDNVLHIEIPRYREDVETYQDIAEEIIREYGYDKVVPSFLSNALVTNGGLNTTQKRELAVKNFLCSQGYYEIQTIAMTSEDDLDQFLIPAEDKERNYIRLLNPITENLGIMRTFMTPSIVRAIEGNLKKGKDSVRLFELANVYYPKDSSLKELPNEIKTLCLGICGKNESFYTIKSSIENLASFCNLKLKFKRTTIPYLHPGRTAEVSCEGVVLGFIGQLRYEIIESLSIAKDKKNEVDIFVAELDYDKLNELFKEEIVYKEPSSFTKAVRDISIVFDKRIMCGDIIDTIMNSSEFIEDVELFDVFESDKLGKDNISMAFKIILSSDSSDITSEDADQIMSNVTKLLEKEYNAIQR